MVGVWGVQYYLDFTISQKVYSHCLYCLFHIMKEEKILATTQVPLWAIVTCFHLLYIDKLLTLFLFLKFENYFAPCKNKVTSSSLKIICPRWGSNSRPSNYETDRCLLRYRGCVLAEWNKTFFFFCSSNLWWFLFLLKYLSTLSGSEFQKLKSLRPKTELNCWQLYFSIKPLYNPKKQN